jgi:hypothetical protein
MTNQGESEAATSSACARAAPDVLGTRQSLMVELLNDVGDTGGRKRG